MSSIPSTDQMTGKEKLPLQAADGKADFSYIISKRTGNPPLRYKGLLLSNETGYRAGTSLWYEIYVYQRMNGGYVVQVICFYKDASKSDFYETRQCKTLGDVFDYLETYDTNSEITSDKPVSDENISVCELTLHGIELRQRMQEAKIEYRHTAGMVFDALLEHENSIH